VNESERADAERFRWLLDGNGYCGHVPVSEEEKNEARKKIDDRRFGRGEWE